MSFSPRLVFVTAPNMDVARNLAQGLLRKHLAACVNLVLGVESHYWWKEKLESGAEVLLVIKSSAEQFEALSEQIKFHHTYDCPEIVAVTPGEMSPSYRVWWESECSGGL